jgi:hypothetical protein
MSRQYTDLTEWVILDIRYYTIRNPHNGDEIVKVQLKKNKKDGKIYRFEEGKRPSKSYQEYKDPNPFYTVVLQYTYKINNKEYMSEIRQLQQNEYQEWTLDVESTQWTNKPITEEEVNDGKQRMRDAIDEEKRKKQEITTRTENERIEREQSAYKFIVNLPTVEKYVEELKNENTKLKDEVSSLEKLLEEKEYGYEYYRKQNMQLDNSIKDLNNEIYQLKQEITRYERKWIGPIFNNSKPRPKQSLVVLMTKLKNISESDDSDHPVHHL